MGLNRLLCLLWSWGDGHLLADRDGRNILGRSWIIFCSRLFRIRYWMISNIPLSLRIGITSGIGLFIALLGLKNTGVIVANKDTLVMIGDLSSLRLLGILAFNITVLSSRHFLPRWFH